MRYVESRYDQYQREWAYRIYVTETLRLASNVKTRFIDIIKPAETGNAEEIISGIMDKVSRLRGDTENGPV